MPNYTDLKVGDKIKLIAVPEADLLQRERELSQGSEDPGWTANTLEKIIKRRRILTIYLIDEYGYPWFECKLRRADGSLEHHSIAIMDNASWKYHPATSAGR